MQFKVCMLPANRQLEAVIKLLALTKIADETFHGPADAIHMPLVYNQAHLLA